jgi:hypothetical protein
VYWVWGAGGRRGSRAQGKRVTSAGEGFTPCFGVGGAGVGFTRVRGAEVGFIWGLDEGE